MRCLKVIFERNSSNVIFKIVTEIVTEAKKIKAKKGESANYLIRVFFW